MELDGQVAIVTGGANGIGRSCAIRLARAGAKIVIADLQADAGADAVSAVQKVGSEAVFTSLDAANKAANESMADLAISTFGGLDILVTAAGISHSSYSSGDVETDLKYFGRGSEFEGRPGMQFVEIEPDEWRRVLEVNLTGTFFAMQACAERMIHAGTHGRMVTIASIAAKHPDAGPVAYTASKAGVWMLTKKAARQLAPANIRVNSVGPGYIRTNMTAMISEFDSAQERLLASVPMGRRGEPEDIANAVFFLISEQSSYMTGEILHPDGGYFTE